MSADDISLEPLLNQSSVGTGSAKKPGFVPVDTVAVASHRTEVSVTDTATQITPTAGYRTLEIHNSGSNVIYYGGSGVTSSNGIPIYPKQTKVYANVKDTFSVYLVAAAGANSTARIVEYT